MHNILRALTLSVASTMMVMLIVACDDDSTRTSDDMLGDAETDTSPNDATSPPDDTGIQLDMPGDAEPSDTGTTDTTPPDFVAPICGDGRSDSGEDCDGTDLRGASCVALMRGFDGGTLACAADCSFDTSGCTSSCDPASQAACADGSCIDAAQACDGNDDCGDASDEPPANLNCSQPEDCSNGRDDDFDGLIDCQDAMCAGTAACSVPPEICDNGQDDNGDGDVDCADSACAFDLVCAVPEVCDNAFDDDLDGALDCVDADCFSDSSCVTGPPEVCDNGLDDDLDGDIDCADLVDCAAAPGCDPPEICDNGLDEDTDGDIDCADSECATEQRCITPEICDSGLDEDGDGNIDCLDADCELTTLCTGCPTDGVRPCLDGNGCYTPGLSCSGFPQCADGSDFFPSNPDCACLPDGEVGLVSTACCNGDPDGNQACGDQGGACITFAQPCGGGGCCVGHCASIAGMSLCCVPDGFDVGDPMFAPVCCNGDADGNAICGDQRPLVATGGEVCDNASDDDGDGFIDCSDADCAVDIACTGCPAGEFECGDGQCIANALVCNGVGDCPGSEEEFPSNTECACIPDGGTTDSGGRCCANDLDGNGVCGDQQGFCSGPGQGCTTDARCCVGTCSPNNLCCLGDNLAFGNPGDPADDCCNGDVDQNGICGQQPTQTFEDCFNGVDDEGDGLADCADPDCDTAATCAGCMTGELECSDGSCLDMASVCDGVADCPDGLDESAQLGCGPMCTAEFDACNPLNDTCCAGACVDFVLPLFNPACCAGPGYIYDPVAPEICCNGDTNGDSACD